MGVITKYLISIVLVIFIAGLLLGTLYTESSASDKKEVSVSNTLQTQIENSTTRIQNILTEDTQADPNDPLQLADYFSKSLAILGEIVSILAAVVSSSVEFVQSILLNLSSLPAPFSVIGAAVTVGIIIFTIYLIMKVASIFVKFDI